MSQQDTLNTTINAKDLRFRIFDSQPTEKEANDIFNGDLWELVDWVENTEKTDSIFLHIIDPYGKILGEKEIDLDSEIGISWPEEFEKFLEQKGDYEITYGKLMEAIQLDGVNLKFHMYIYNSRLGENDPTNDWITILD